MFATERQERIVQEVRERGAVRVAELSALLGVSDMTIRRDLDALAAQHKLDKVHGGATVPRATSTEEPGFIAKSRRQLPEKEAIAQAAVEEVKSGSAIGLSAGTTTATLARLLLTVPDLTIVTNSMRIADIFHNADTTSHNVVLTGGVRTPSDALVGPLAVSALQQLHLDVVFLGVHGMDPVAGFTTPNMLEAETNRALVTAGRRLVVLADHTKWHTIGISTIARLDQADILISDGSLTPSARHALHERVGELRLVEVTSGA